MKDEGQASGACEMIEHLAFSTGPGIGARARIGLVVLASDYTMEHEFRRVFTTPGVDYYEARIRNSPQITPETLAAMGPLLTDTVDLILPGAKLDVVAFGCTSASMVLGEAAVEKAIHAARPGAKATNPMRSCGMVSPASSRAPKPTTTTATSTARATSTASAKPALDSPNSPLV